MDSLKVIPQVFFDLIGRVVPGAVGSVTWLLLTGTTWESWLSVALGKSLATDSSVVAILVFLATAYVTGQLLSPVAKLIQRIGEFFSPEPKAKDYDLLRLKSPEVGGYCAKIRAEFTMHNGLAAVFLIGAFAYPLRGQDWRWSVLIGLILIGLLEAFRGRTTRDTFNKTVNNFALALESRINSIKD
ncbi:hypothetical protein [Burkholderia ubonensis]|uniref:hypothetical protein n=1 Tax=Burkholderia ubonensis TaxID=101571 RepID=UPI00076C19AE|nr:hypothetical protein [Burkholderia ubonensis]KWB61814.1 hypothetical protein WL38_24985 [Burkholderia ubonensis]KWB62689.1 hypothetical protein WL39_17535 [Burkholderia ubonensis]